MSQLQRGDSENKLCWDPFTCDFHVFKGLTPMIDHQRSHIKPARCYFSGPAFIAPKAAAPEASFKKISGLGSLGISTLGYNDTMWMSLLDTDAYSLCSSSSSNESLNHCNCFEIRWHCWHSLGTEAVQAVEQRGSAQGWATRRMTVSTESLKGWVKGGCAESVGEQEHLEQEVLPLKVSLTTQEMNEISCHFEP